jgi:hypothetical protein
VLDVRVYRTAFLPALVALFVAAFALADRPQPSASPLTTDAFSAERAFGNQTPPPPDSLLGLARAFPARAAGSAGDAALAEHVAQALAAPDQNAAGGRPAFEVHRIDTEARTRKGTVHVVTVVGTRPGSSSRRIVVLAHRDASGRPGLAELSGTAALLELARAAKTLVLQKTLVLVSTSGATTGFAGARAWASEAAGGPVDGVIVLGDVAGTRVHKPWVVSWPSSSGSLPLGLERTVQAAVRTESKSDPGGPRALAQWIRRALGVTLSEQGPVGAQGLPAVLLSASGERGPAPGERVLQTRMDVFGRAALRAVSAIDAAAPRDAPAFRGAPRGIVTLRNVLPDWAVRLVVGTALLPALLVALDAFFRARRRRVAVVPALRWLAVAALPAPVAWVWLWLLGLAGLLAVADGPVLPRLYPLGTAGGVAMASACLAAAVAWFAARLLAGRARGAPDGLAVATGLAICGLAAIVWVPNPYAAALLAPAAHLWLFAAGGWRGRPAAVAALAGLALPLVAIVYLGLALGLGPLDLAWGSALAAAGGAGLATTLVLAVYAAALAGLLRVLLARRRTARATEDGGAIKTRGPLSYAGPGSLGGTESALRR